MQSRLTVMLVVITSHLTNLIGSSRTTLFCGNCISFLLGDIVEGAGSTCSSCNDFALKIPFYKTQSISIHQ